MVHNILDALRAIKADVATHLQAATIERLCPELDYNWRERTLGLVVTIHAFLMQVLHGNTACDHVPHLIGDSAAARQQEVQPDRISFVDALRWLTTTRLASCGP